MPSSKTKGVFVLQTHESEIVIRPRRNYERTHLSSRRLIVLTESDEMLVLEVNKVRPYLQKQALMFHPEKPWKRCPNCKKGDWPAWMPMKYDQCHVDGDLHNYTHVRWLIVCIHCTVIADIRNFGPYAEDPGEYLYDSAREFPTVIPLRLQERTK